MGAQGGCDYANNNKKAVYCCHRLGDWVLSCLVEFGSMCYRSDEHIISFKFIGGGQHSWSMQGLFNYVNC